MQLPVITCYNPTKSYPDDSFYILCKGINSGRPMDKPCPNCFVAMCESREIREVFFWLCYALWKSRRVEYHLIGSVIPFIRLREFKSILASALCSAEKQEKNFKRFVDMMVQHEIQSRQITNQLNRRLSLIQTGLRLCIQSKNK